MGDRNMNNYTPAGFYSFIYHHLTKIAHEHGYALALHGSMTRDLDLVAVPWVEDAKEPTALVRAIREAVCGTIINEWNFEDCAVKRDFSKRNPSIKPHGRLSWTI
jgi:hypothetical protein